MPRNNGDFESGKVSPADLTFTFKPASMSKYHYVEAHLNDQGVGGMEWHAGTGKIRQITVAEEHRRKGIATALLGEGRRIASSSRGVKSPRHSEERTNEGEAWARSLGERLPRRYLP